MKVGDVIVYRFSKRKRSGNPEDYKFAGIILDRIDYETKESEYDIFWSDLMRSEKISVNLIEEYYEVVYAAR